MEVIKVEVTPSVQVKMWETGWQSPKLEAAPGREFVRELRVERSGHERTWKAVTELGFNWHDRGESLWVLAVDLQSYFNFKCLIFIFCHFLFPGDSSSPFSLEEDCRGRHSTRERKRHPLLVTRDILLWVFSLFFLNEKSTPLLLKFPPLLNQ